MGPANRPDRRGDGDGPGSAGDARTRSSRPRTRLGVRAVACLSGVSLERGVPAGEIHDYILEADNVVWVDVQDPGPGGDWRC